MSRRPTALVAITASVATVLIGAGGVSAYAAVTSAAAVRHPHLSAACIGRKAPHALSAPQYGVCPSGTTLNDLASTVSSVPAAPGVPGPAGPAGPAGAHGTTAVKVVRQTANIKAATDYTIVVSCPGGTVATGGGFSAPDPLHVFDSAPRYVGNNPPTGWGVRVYNSGGNSHEAKAFVLCATT